MNKLPLHLRRVVLDVLHQGASAARASAQAHFPEVALRQVALGFPTEVGDDEVTQLAQDLHLATEATIEMFDADELLRRPLPGDAPDPVPAPDPAPAQ